MRKEFTTITHFFSAGFVPWEQVAGVGLKKFELRGDSSRLCMKMALDERKLRADRSKFRIFSTGMNGAIFNPIALRLIFTVANGRRADMMRALRNCTDITTTFNYYN